MKHENIKIAKHEIRIIGIKCSVKPEETTKTLGVLWDTFNAENLAQTIPNQAKPGSLYCVYTDYRRDGSYNAILGCAVDSIETIPTDMTHIDIAAGPYARYAVGGEMPAALIHCWNTINSTPLDYQRAFKTDFDYYTPEALEGKGDVFVYVGIK